MVRLIFLFLFTTYLCVTSLARDATNAKYYDQKHFKNKINNLSNKWIDRNYNNNFDDFIAHIIIRFKNSDIIPQIKSMCEKNITNFQQNVNLGQECYLGDKCQYIFEKTIVGLYGKFQMSNLRKVIERCFNNDDVDFIELDNKVSKSQGRQQLQSEQTEHISSKNGENSQFVEFAPIGYISPQQENYDDVVIQQISRKNYESQKALYIPNFKDEQLDEIGTKTVQLLSKDVLSQILLVSDNKSQEIQQSIQTLYNIKSNFVDKHYNSSYEHDKIKQSLALNFFNKHSNNQKDVQNMQNVNTTNYNALNIQNKVNINSSSGNKIDDEPVVQSFSVDNEKQNKEAFNSPKGLKSQQVESGLWNLDRIDQASLPLDGRFNFGGDKHVGTGRGVTVYVLDSGIRATHTEFMDLSQSRQRARVGADFVDNDGNGADCDGHGTHIASTAVGRAVGVAKEAELVGVRVLDCMGVGTVGNVVKALEWVAEDRKGPAVVMLSLGVESGEWSLGLEQAVQNLIQVHNISVVVASGNMGVDSCSISPANVGSTVTVAASNLQNKFDSFQYFAGAESIYQYSNTGSCVDIFAPGVDIFGACGGESKCGFVHDQAYAWDDGTSMAVPHVAGAVAVILGEFPSASPKEIKEILIRSSTADKIAEYQLLPNTPNRMLHIDITQMASIQSTL